jgi:hypothetical protein
VVIIRDETANPLRRMGSIVELFPGKDGVVRAIRVKTAQVTYKRPVQKIGP